MSDKYVFHKELDDKKIKEPKKKEDWLNFMGQEEIKVCCNKGVDPLNNLYGENDEDEDDVDDLMEKCDVISQPTLTDDKLSDDDDDLDNPDDEDNEDDEDNGDKENNNEENYYEDELLGKGDVSSPPILTDNEFSDDDDYLDNPDDEDDDKGVEDNDEDEDDDEDEGMEDNDDENYADYDDDLGRPFGVEMGNSQDSKLPALCNYIKNDEFILPALCDNIIKKSENADASELPYNENEVVIRTNRWFAGKRTVGLKGGVSNDLEPSNPRLKLINNRGSEGTTNICFVNASIQLFRKTGYAQFLLTHMEPLLVGQVDTVNYKCCRALLSLYTESSNRGRSAANVRRLVSARSLKRHLNNGSQQDASEFLDSLVNVVISECSAIEAFVAVQSSHWG